MKTSALTSYNGVATCDNSQVNLSERHSNHSTLPTGNSWTCQQNNANNAYYVAIPTANVNNNNKNNTYAVLPVAEFEQIVSLLLRAEAECYKNKSHRMNATKYHYHLSQIYELAERLQKDEYKPEPSVCFALTYPKLREVFAAMYVDRIIHHLIAPFIMDITERLHESNGNVSHGNRPKMSAQTAAEQLQEWMRMTPGGYVITMDIQGFFMNLDRQLTFDKFLQFYNHFSGAHTAWDEMQLKLLRELLLNDPAVGCYIHSPLSLLNKVPANKSLRNNTGKGLPIGNYYSQIMANMISAIWGMALMKTPGVRIVQFVDDMAVVIPDACVAHALREMSAWVLSGIRLSLHPKKFYCQPIKHGAYFCGRYVFANRIYTANRTVRACKGKIYAAIKLGATIESARRLMCSINSYTGMMCHAKSFNRQRELMYLVLQSDYCKYLYFVQKNNHLVCQVFDEYKEKTTSTQNIVQLCKQYKKYKNEYRKSKCCA